MIKKIHLGHLGIEKCKLRAREIIYWPNMNTQLEDYLSHCQACLTYKNQNCKEPLMQHEVPNRAWSKVGIDVFHFGTKSFVLIIDYYSKFVELIKINCLKSELIVKKIKQVFSRHGIPEIVMTDNGPEFASNTFREFSHDWKFQHVTSSPRYPQSNGQVERAIQTIKNMMRKTAYDQAEFPLALLEYLNTPISKELASPAELLYNRKLRSIVPCSPNLLLPKINTDVINKLKRRQQKQKMYYDKVLEN
ncbi:unnamed protein product [Parnassius mnemosyne]|uniref:RNA-directed DNA polymerase n=1 Tax=Parnassius mnemosyne TaxID=213953 RepID=A0AAV1LRH9_9NEOP